MSRELEFFFDFRSPYSYLAFSQLPDLGVKVVLRPMTVLKAVNGPQEVRVEAWWRLARDLDLKKLARTTQTVCLAEVPEVVAACSRARCRAAPSSTSTPEPAARQPIRIARKSNMSQADLNETAPAWLAFPVSRRVC
jgi:2-hydroxychromene-2-carboxylate isomerase